MLLKRAAEEPVDEADFKEDEEAEEPIYESAAEGEDEEAEEPVDEADFKEDEDLKQELLIQLADKNLEAYKDLMEKKPDPSLGELEYALELAEPVPSHRVHDNEKPGHTSSKAALLDWRESLPTEMARWVNFINQGRNASLLYTSPSQRDRTRSRMPTSA